MTALTINATPTQIRAWRSTRAWRTLARQVVRDEPTCWLHLPTICTIRSTTADHIIPVAHRPDLAMERTNLHGACKPCNDYRRDTPIHQLGTLRANLLKTPPAQRTPSRARRHISAPRRPSRTAGAFFATTATRTRNTLQHNTSHTPLTPEKHCGTSQSTAVGPDFFAGPT